MTHMALVTGTRIVHVVILAYSSSCVSTEDVGHLTSSLKSQFRKLFYSDAQILLISIPMNSV